MSGSWGRSRCSHHSLGSRMNESYIRMSGSPFFVHSPPGPRNVGMPLSADIPAPTSAMA